MYLIICRQIRNGQLEVVTGGWVMNDESNPHYWNMLDQMMEGHIWMQQHIGRFYKHNYNICTKFAIDSLNIFSKLFSTFSVLILFSC